LRFREPRETASGEEKLRRLEAGSMRISLRVVEGPHTGQSFQFEGHDTFLVGRSDVAHFRLANKDRFFSRVHFMVELNPPHCRLMDMGSRNGTLVNGQKVETIDLKDGDRIQAGKTVLYVAVEQTSTAPMPVVAAVPAPATPRAAPVVAAPPVAPPPPRPVEAPTGNCPACAAPMAAATAICAACQELVRQQAQPIAGYQIIKELGRGAMGVVSLALQTSSNALVALKTIIPAVAGTRNQVDRFLREANILRQLAHPNIVALRDLGESSGQLFFAMEYIRGTDAHKLMQRHGGKLPVRDAVQLTCQLLDGLADAHDKGFVHRDIKPGNLLVTTVGGRTLVKLADFGLARVYQTSQLSGLTMMGEIAGTVAFMAPEQITQFRQVKPTADQYSAAATLYNLVAGRFTYDLPRLLPKQIVMILQEDPIPLEKRCPDIAPELAAIVHRGLARHPGARFPDVQAMRAALARFA
jgi:serine/threonine-protein kinase